MHPRIKRLMKIKKIILTMFVLLVCLTLSATVKGQNVSNKMKTIQVVGKAQEEVTPDIIYIQITLKEYKKGGRKINMNKLESELVTAVDKLNLPKENLTVDNVYGNNWNWRKRKSDEFFAAKSFKLKVNELSIINDLVDNLDEDGINALNVNQYEYSKIEELQDELKIRAIKTAKEKAKKMLSAIDEELGSAIEVSETDINYVAPNFNDRARSAQLFRAKQESYLESDYNSELNFKTIKLKAEIRVVFEIK